MTMKRNDDAVSPVIGVILMVAITVILAAVIAAFVFGLVGGVEGAKVVGVTATKINDTAVGFTWQGGADLGALINATALLDGNDEQVVGDKPYTVGSRDIVDFKGEDVAGKRVTLVGEFEDGIKQVLLERTF
ncbi:MAG: type IV pilin [Methanocalculus sp. MSAO_Arc1]|uniref:type IV pilin n=1 Tax=Methanocalculus TaxID=71151 RepID=UPI000FF67CF1|nr:MULTISPECIES: type IV pilin N-terminal domain-containing protein [unclassified Methanocalculus]MCP1661838.1 flagellin-like protein [Methanocalculus sp. AMF5]RQD81971.1 MAG: type IV pilin [Methanocalculus sp. MSAO_Arc1]